MDQRQMQRALDRRNVTITEVDPVNSHIQAKDNLGTQMMINVVNKPTFFQLPVAGEVWQVSRQGSEWFLESRIDSPDVLVPLTDMKPGDARVEAPGTIWLGGNVRIIGNLNDQINIFSGDSADTIVAKIASLPSTGGHLHFGAGKFTGPITIIGKNNLTITGEGSTSTIHNTSSNLDALKCVNCDDLTIRDLRVQGTTGTRDGLHLENCQRSQIKVFCGGTGRAAIWAQRCFGIMIDPCEVSVNSGPYPTGVAPMQAGLVLTWDNADVTSGCNQATIHGGVYVIGQTPQSSISTTQFTPGWAIQLIRCEGATISGGPIHELGSGGIYAQFCERLTCNLGYSELNPSDIEYSTGTMSVTAAGTAVTGVGTTWNNTAISPEQPNGAPGKYLVAPLGAGMSFAKVASLNSNTSLTLAAQTELLQTGWPGTTQTGVAYRLVSFDVFLDQCLDCTINGGRGGGAIALKGSSRNILNVLTDSLLVDANSILNEGIIVTNRASSSTNRIISTSTNTGNRFRQMNWQTNGIVREFSLASYLSVNRPSATESAGQLIYVANANNRLQYSDGSTWIAAGRPFLGSSPPSSPQDGDEWIYNGLSGIYWRFIYDSSEPTYKWKFIGGPAFSASDSGDLATPANPWMSVSGMAAIPRSGDYHCYFHDQLGFGNINAGTTVNWSVYLGDGSTTYADPLTSSWMFDTSVLGAYFRTATGSGNINLASGTTLQLWHQVSGWDVVSYARNITYTPIRVI
jgi:hypothetical protein